MKILKVAYNEETFKENLCRLVERHVFETYGERVKITLTEKVKLLEPID